MTMDYQFNSILETSPYEVANLNRIRTDGIYLCILLGIIIASIVFYFYYKQYLDNKREPIISN